MPVDWLLIQMDNLMNQSYNLTQAALGTHILIKKTYEIINIISTRIP